MLQLFLTHAPEKLKQFMGGNLVCGWAGQRVLRGKNPGDDPAGARKESAAFHARFAPRMAQHFFHDSRAHSDTNGHPRQCTLRCPAGNTTTRVAAVPCQTVTLRLLAADAPSRRA